MFANKMGNGDIMVLSLNYEAIGQHFMCLHYAMK